MALEKSRRLLVVSLDDINASRVVDKFVACMRAPSIRFGQSGLARLATIGCSPTGSERADDVEHGTVDSPVRGENFGAPRAEGGAGPVAHSSASFLDNERAGGDIPRFEVGLPKSVHSSRRDITEIYRGGAKAANGASLADEGTKEADNLVHASVNIVREPGDKHRVD
jgi:hypothetical protein